MKHIRALSKSPARASEGGGIPLSVIISFFTDILDALLVLVLGKEITQA